MNRRTLLFLLGAGSAAAAISTPWLRGSAAARRHVLVLVELRGGNDGLNTVAPIHDPVYREARPSLALSESLPLKDGLALHPALSPLLPSWRNERLAFALGVGWPRPNRSHFKAADQWATGSSAGEGPGWLAAAFDERRSAGPLVALGPSGCAAMEGGRVLALQLAPAQLRGRPDVGLDPDRAGSNPILRRLLALEQAGQQELQSLRKELAPLPKDLTIPRSGLGQQVALALRLIGSGASPPVLQLAQGGYDTHAHQANRHQVVLSQLAEALAAFEQGLERLPDRPRVTLLAVSEFGRRLRENGSRGTDHGSASIALLLGDEVPHPFLGTYPSLHDLDDRGDLIAGLNPRDLYRRVLPEGVPG